MRISQKSHVLGRCFRNLLLVARSHFLVKTKPMSDSLKLELLKSNYLPHKVLSVFQQQLMTEAPNVGRLSGVIVFGKLIQQWSSRRFNACGRELRGLRRVGCWADEGWPCRSAFRVRFEPDRRSDHIGFRITAVRP
jgi:hypothetical protein